METTTKHTPGPWETTLGPGSGAVNLGVCVRSATTGEYVATRLTEANAGLIAAAPDLLAALRDLLEQATGPAMIWGDGRGADGTKTGPTHDEFCAMRDARIAAARSALSRATGGAS